MTSTQKASIFTAVVGIAAVIASSAAAQTTGCEPVAQRSGREFGCFITARRELGALPRDSALYWHLDAFDTPLRPSSEDWAQQRGAIPRR